MSIRCESRGKSRLISKLSACFLPLLSRRPELLRVDSSRQEETELGRLMHDFRCKEAKEMHSRILANRVRQLKETQKGVEIMCKEMDAIYRQGEKRGERRGRAQAIIETKRETALRMKERGYSDDSIAELLKIKVSMVQKWYEEAKSV